MRTEVIENEVVNQIVKSKKFLALSLEGKLSCAVSGLCEEAGEVAGLLNREVYKQNDVPYFRWVEELGDVLWYVVAVASLKGITLEEIFDHNTYKLQKRYGESYGNSENRNPSS